MLRLQAFLLSVLCAHACFYDGGSLWAWGALALALHTLCAFLDLPSAFPPYPVRASSQVRGRCSLVCGGSRRGGHHWEARHVMALQELPNRRELLPIRRPLVQFHDGVIRSGALRHGERLDIG